MTENNVNPTTKNTQAFASWQRMMGYLRPYRHWALVAFFSVLGTALLQGHAATHTARRHRSRRDSG